MRPLSLLSSCLLLATACSDRHLTFTLQSSPLFQEDPLAGVDVLELRWKQPDGSAQIEHVKWNGYAAQYFKPPKALAGAQLELAAVGGGAVLAVGRSRTLGEGDTSLVNTLYLGRVNRFSAPPFDRPFESARYAASSTALADGRVLIAGGATRGTARAVEAASISAMVEIYDPQTGGFQSSVPTSFTERVYHGAVALPSGEALLVGGLGKFGALDDIVRIDPNARTATVIGHLPSPRYGHATALLDDGTILVVGGYVIPDGSGGGTLAPDAVLVTTGGQVTPVALPSPRAFATATALGDGTALISGGSDADSSSAHEDALLFSSASRQFTPLTPTGGARATMLTPRAGHTATRLASGLVLFFGGNDGHASVAAPELYSPAVGGFTDVTRASLTPREHHGAVLLPDDSVLFIGGENAAQRSAVPSPVVEMLRFKMVGDSASMLSTDLPPSSARAEATAILLRDGSVLYTGGAVGGRSLTGGTDRFVPCFDDCLTIAP